MSVTEEAPETKPRRARTRPAVEHPAPPMVGFAVTLPQAKLLPVLTAAARCAAEKSTLPILKNVLLETRDGKLIVTATNTVTTLQQSVPVLSEVPGILSTPARELAAFVGALPAGDVLFSQDGTQLEIRGGRTQFRTGIMPSEDFLVSKVLPDDRIEFSLPAEALQSLIRETIYAVNAESSTPAFSSVCLRLRDGKLAFYATDSHRLGFREETCLAEGEIDLLFPAESIREVARLMNGSDVTIALTPNQAEFRLPNLVFRTLLVAGGGANYWKVLEGVGTLRYVLPRTPFVEMLKRMRLAQGESSRTVLTFGESLVARATGASARCEEDVDLVAGDAELELAASADYLIQPLEALREERVEILLKDPLAPILLRPEGRANSWSMVMPMQMGETE